MWCACMGTSVPVFFFFFFFFFLFVSGFFYVEREELIVILLVATMKLFSLFIMKISLEYKTHNCK